MNYKENNIRTDEAWDKLYNRIKEDGLLNMHDNTEPGIFKSVTFRWVAGIAILCICSVIGLMVYNTRSISPDNMLTLHNNETTTLVTTLEDGTTVYLTKQASLSYPEHFEDKKREVFFQGDAFFDINKSPDRPFFIETELVKIEVLGTAFNVKTLDGKSFSLSVLRGEVKVTSKTNGMSSHIKAGQSVSLKNKDMQVTNITVANEFDNYTKQIHFKDERLSDIVRVINSHSGNIKIELEPQLENRLLTVTFIEETIPSMAQLICMALNLKYEQKQNTIELSELK